MANLFIRKPLMETPQLTKPVEAYDPTKSVEQNMAGQGQPSAKNITDAYQTPTAQLRTQQPTSANTQPARTIPTIDPTSDTAGMDAISQMYTSRQEEDRLRKASVANQRILAVADALRHIGNIYNTVRYAPAQKFNSPVLEEYDRYQKGKALRDAANIRYMNYQQQKAAQDRAAAKMDMEFKLKQADDARKERLNDARISRYNSQNAKDGANKAYWETRARLLEEGYPLEKAIKEARKAQIEEQTRLTRVKADQGGFAPRRSGGGGSGAKYWDYDEEGNIHYYPNKTMWEQGVEEHSQNQDPNEKYPTGKKDLRGNEEQKTRKRKTVEKAGKNAYRAHKGSNVRNFSIRDRNKKSNSSNKGKFSIHN